MSDHYILKHVREGKQRVCSRCNESKAPSLFNKDCYQASGLSPHCRECEAKRKKTFKYYQKGSQELRERGHKYYQANKERILKRQHKDWPKKRARALTRMYGIDEADYARMLLEQKGSCAICGRKEAGDGKSKYLYIDHDHKTGRVRGLLCWKCNTALGMLEDNVKSLCKAISYLKK